MSEGFRRDMFFPTEFIAHKTFQQLQKKGINGKEQKMKGKHHWLPKNKKEGTDGIIRYVNREQRKNKEQFKVKQYKKKGRQKQDKNIILKETQFCERCQAFNHHHPGINERVKDLKRENKRRVPHKYSVGDLVLIRRDVTGEVLRKVSGSTYGPYPVLKVLQTALVLDRGNFTEVVHLRRVLPYYKRPL